jgi:hypothetical protein
MKVSFKEIKETFSKRAFFGCLLALAICWFMKLFGITHFNLDLDNKLFLGINDFMTTYNLTNIYYTLTLSIQVYLLYCIVNRTKGKKAILYSLAIVPLNVLVRVMTSRYELLLGNWAILIEFVYLMLVASKFNYKRFLRAIFVIGFLLLYQALSIMLRDYEIKAHTYSLIAELILSIDLYILLLLHREVSFMNGGTWLIFGFTAWIYSVAGFIVGIFTRHPIKKAKEYYAKGKAKEDARKTKKANRKLATAK